MSAGKKNLPVYIDIEAKAEFKAGVQTTIPEKSSGRLVDALTDLIRPISEKRGLQGDRIRLQREDVALEIAKKARQRIDLEGEEIVPVSNKLLIPLIEYSSNEDVDDEGMHDRWANLLAAAATKSNVEPRYIGILRELHGRQAELFEKICRNAAEFFPRPVAQLEDTPTLLAPAMIAQRLKDLFKLPSAMLDPEYVMGEILDWVDRPGCALIDIICHHRDDMHSLQSDRNFSDVEHGLDLQILSSLGLIKEHNQFYSPRAGIDLQVIYYSVSDLGVHFFRACTNAKIEDSISDPSED